MATGERDMISIRRRFPVAASALAAGVLILGLTAAQLLAADDDGDGIDDAVDNYVGVFNPEQTNSDSGPPPPPGNTGGYSNGPSIAGDDVTIPSGDEFGDACDDDRDNDGRLDADELAGTNCASASGDGTTLADPSLNAYGTIIALTIPPP